MLYPLPKAIYCDRSRPTYLEEALFTYFQGMDGFDENRNDIELFIYLKHNFLYSVWNQVYLGFLKFMAAFKLKEKIHHLYTWMHTYTHKPIQRLFGCSIRAIPNFSLQSTYYSKELLKCFVFVANSQRNS